MTIEIARDKLSARGLDYPAIKAHLEAQRKAKDQQVDQLPDEDEFMAFDDPEEIKWAKQFYAAVSSHRDEAHRMVQYDTFIEEMRENKRLRSSSA